MATFNKGLGSLFGTVFPGVETWVWMLMIAVLTAVYLVVGGYVATAYTDLVQGIVMIVAAMAISLVIVPFVSALTKNNKAETERVEEIFAGCKEE